MPLMSLACQFVSLTVTHSRGRTIPPLCPPLCVSPSVAFNSSLAPDTISYTRVHYASQPRIGKFFDLSPSERDSSPCAAGNAYVNRRLKEAKLDVTRRATGNGQMGYEGQWANERAATTCTTKARKRISRRDVRPIKNRKCIFYRTCGSRGDKTALVSFFPLNSNSVVPALSLRAQNSAARPTGDRSRCLTSVRSCRRPMRSCTWAAPSPAPRRPWLPPLFW